MPPTEPRQALLTSRMPERAAAISAKAWLMLLHATGTLAILLWILRQFIVHRQTVHNGTPISSGPAFDLASEISRDFEMRRMPELRLSQTAGSPFAFGLWRPGVVLPEAVAAKLPLKELRSVLAHELAHLRRGDLWVHWLQFFLLAVWWFHPAIWLLNRGIRQAREDCCDDLLLSRGVNSSDGYCQALLRTAQELCGRAPAAVALGLGGDLHPLGRRMVRIMDSTQRRWQRLPLAGYALIAILAALLLPGLPSAEPLPATKNPPSIAAAPAVDWKTKSIPELFDAIQLGAAWSDRAQAPILREIRRRGGEAVSFLTSNLDAGKPDLVRKSAWLLRIFGQNTQPAIASLTASLKRNDPELSRIAAETLGHLAYTGGIAAMPNLLDSLLQGNWNAAFALISMGGHSTNLYASALLDTFRSTKTPLKIREKLAIHLADWHPQKALAEAALVEVYEAAPEILKSRIAFTLYRMDARSPAALAIRERAPEASSPTLGINRNPYARHSVPELVELIRQPPWQVADGFAAIEISNRVPLNQRKEDMLAAVPALIEMVSDPTRFTRMSAAGALHAIGPHAVAAVPALIDFVKDPEGRNRGLGIYALTAIAPQTREVIDAVLAAIDDPDPKLSADAIASLRDLGPAAREAIPRLQRVIEAGKNPQKRLHGGQILPAEIAEEVLKEIHAKVYLL